MNWNNVASVFIVLKIFRKGEGGTVCQILVNARKAAEAFLLGIVC